MAVWRCYSARLIIAVELGDPDGPRRVLVVGCIHGSEPAGIAIATGLTRGSPPTRADLWIVPDLNPDGVAAGTRQNADGVDLNRNFPFHCRPLGPPGSLFYAGPRPLSEPESRLAARLILRIRPVLAIWYHQALNVVDDSQEPPAAERRYASLTGMREVRLIDYPGSAVGWEDATIGPTAFVVELPAGPLSPAGVSRHVAALRSLLHDRDPAITTGCPRACRPLSADLLATLPVASGARLESTRRPPWTVPAERPPLTARAASWCR
jgi:protein MpaA